MVRYSKNCRLKIVEAYKKQYNLNFVSVMPCNMYGPKDNYDEKNSHVMAALIKSFVLQKKKSKSCQSLGTVNH